MCKELHLHKCPSEACGVIWQHRASQTWDAKEFRLAHTCPVCGSRQQYMHHLGREETIAFPYDRINRARNIYRLCRIYERWLKANSYGESLSADRLLAAIADREGSGVHMHWLIKFCRIWECYA